MESDDEYDSFDGSEPEFGAIFMASRATKIECLRQRLFGLPSAYGRFVMQVKTGMILFLFEYESRQLHGVFQACSDGQMNIFRRAYSSSGKGKQFPAQVKVKPIWDCRPLSESEFSGAIKENYFKKTKFNFGLSKSQVRRLLTLFNSRKIKDMRPERDIARSKGARPVSTLAEVREVDDGRSISNDKVNNELDADNNSAPMMIQYPENSSRKVGNVDHGRFTGGNVDCKGGEITQSGHLGHLPGKDGRDNPNFVMFEKAVNELTVEIADVTSELDMLCQSGKGDDDQVIHGRAGMVNCLDAKIMPATSTEYPGYPSAKVERIHDDGRFLISDKLQYQESEGKVYGPPISVDCPAFCQSSFHTPTCSSIGVQETECLVGDQTRSTATLSHQMELPVGSHSNAGSYGDVIVTRNLPFDPDAPSPNLPYSQPIDVNHSSNSVGDWFDSNGILSMTNPLSHLCPEPDKVNHSLGVTSEFVGHVPFVGPDYYDHSSPGNIIAFSGALYSEEMTLKNSRKQNYAGPVLSSSVALGTLTEIGTNERKIRSCPFYSLSPSNHPPFVCDQGHPVALQNELEHDIAQNVNCDPFAANVTSSEEHHRKLQTSVHPGEHDSVDHREDFDHGQKSSESSEDRKSELLSNRSVFSRLKVNPNMTVKKNSMPVGYEANDEDTSVDEIMAMLTDCSYPWVPSKKSKGHSALDRNRLEVPENSKMASVTPVEDTDDQIREEIPFVDFKRRSQLPKVDGATKVTTIDESAGNDGVPGGPRKRRRLIRPNFINTETRDDKSTSGKTSPILQTSSRESSVNDNGKRRKLVRPTFRENVPCDDKSSNGNASMILQYSSQQFSISEESSGICHDSVGSQDKLVLQGSELSHVVHRSCLENDNIKTERYSKFERETQVKSSGAALKIGTQDKLLLQVSELSHVVQQNSVNGNTEIERSAEYQRETQVDSSGAARKIGHQDTLLLQGSGLSHVVHQSRHENENIQTGRVAKCERETLVNSSGVALDGGSQDKLLLQASALSHVVDHRSQANENIETERFAKYERETEERSGTTLKVGDGGKETLQDAGSQIARLAISCEQNDQKGFSNKERCDDKSRNGNTSLISKAPSQESSDTEYANGKRRKLVRPNFRENIPSDDKSRNENTSLISKTSSQESSDGEYANGKRRKLVRPNFRENIPCDGKSLNGNASVISEASSQQSSDSEYANGKRRKLVLPKYREKKQCDDKSINVNTSMSVQVSSHQCSFIEDANGMCEDSAGSQDKLVRQGTELSHVVYLSSRENENSQTETAPKCERERKVESLVDTLQAADEGGKESICKVGGSQIEVFTILDEGNISNAEKDSARKHPILNKSSQDCHDSGHSTVQESAVQVPRPRIECGRGNDLELLLGDEFCPNKSVVSISNLTGSSRDMNSELQKVATEGASCADACTDDNNQSEAPLDTVGCFDKQELSQEHRVAKEVARCADACIGDNHYGSSLERSEAPFDTVGCFDKQEPYQEHRSTNLSELSSGTVSLHDKLEPSPGQNLNVRLGESLLFLSVLCRRDVLPVSSKNVCTSSGISTSVNVVDKKVVLTSDNVEDKKVVLTPDNVEDMKGVRQNNVGIKNVEDKKVVLTSDNVEDKKGVRQNNIGIKKRKLKRDGKEKKGLADEFELEDKKDALQNRGGIEKHKLKRSCKQNTKVADEFESGRDDCVTVECERENQRLWRILTAKLIELKNAQQH